MRRLLRQVQHNDVVNGGAALGFYLTLAIFPATIFLMALIPYLPIPHVDEAIMDLLRQALPGRAARIVSSVVEQVTSEQRGGLLSVGIVGALWAASTGMYAIMQQLNIAFAVRERRGFLHARATALVLTLLFGGLVLAAFSLVVLGGVVQDWIGDRFGYTSLLLAFFVVFRWVVIVFALMLGLALVYRFAPNRVRPFRLVTCGTVAATVMMIAASAVLSWYTLHFADYSAVYGSIGAVIVLMLSLFVSGLVVLIGAEIDSVLEQASAPKHARARAPREAARGQSIAG